MKVMQWLKHLSRFLNRISLIGKWMHLYRVRKARGVIKKLKLIARDPHGYPKIIVYLRKINPFVFEELVLSVIEDNNTRVIRNKRYTGDGGIDGRFVTRQGKVLVQCKRYQSYINPRHVMELSTKVRQDGHHVGIFVHTGKTGAQSKSHMQVEKNIVFISGSVLVDLILGRIHIERHLEQKLKYLSSTTFTPLQPQPKKSQLTKQRQL